MCKVQLLVINPWIHKRNKANFLTKNNFSFNAMVEEDGDYRLCFDNTPSRWSDKIVWFEIQVEDPEDDYDDDYFDPDAWEDIKSHNEDTESLFNMGIEEIKSSVHLVRLQINKMRHYFFMNAAQMSKVRGKSTFRIFVEVHKNATTSLDFDYVKPCLDLVQL